MGLKPPAAVYEWTLKPSTRNFERLFFDCIVNTFTRRKVYNNDDITIFADRAATHYHTLAWQTLKHGKECFILLLYEPHREKTGLQGFRPGPTQTGLNSH